MCLRECTEDDQELFEEMVNTEFEALSKVDNPNVVKVYRTSTSGVLKKVDGKTRNNVLYIIMEFC